MKPHHRPWTFVAFTVPGVICLLAGGAALAGMLKGVHPLFGSEHSGGPTQIAVSPAPTIHRAEVRTLVSAASAPAAMRSARRGLRFAGRA
jgi:hypothetical protein